MASTSEARLNLKLSRSFGKAPDKTQNFDFAQCMIDFGVLLQPIEELIEHVWPHLGDI